MYSVNGKRLHPLDPAEIAAWAAAYSAVLLDLGTGDGRFVRDQARRHPDLATIGVDTCAERMRDHSRTAPANARFLVADALALPPALRALATRVTINFPWGSLLRGLLAGEVALPTGACGLEIRLNGEALAEAGWALAEAGARLGEIVRRHGYEVESLVPLGAGELRVCPTTWGRRLAFGRDPRAIELLARRAGAGSGLRHRQAVGAR